MTSSIKASNPPRSSVAFNYRHVALMALCGLMFVLFFYGLGSYPLFDMDEPRYAEAAREMIESGNWVTPYFNYEPRFDKPVLFYWLIAWAYQVFGVSEFSARLISALSATLTVGAVYAFGRHWISHRFGLFSALILSTSIMFVGLARMSITDMTLSFLMTATSLSLFMAVHRNLRWWLVAGLFSGLAVLTKGPVGLVVPGAILVLYTWSIGAFRRVLLNRWFLLGLLTCLAVAFPWYYQAYLENGMIFINALLFHNVTRFSDTVSGHDQPIYFYVIVLVVGFLPWTAYLPAAIHGLIRQVRTEHAQRVRQADWTYLVPLYSAIWAAFIFVFFTVSSTKLLTYILPLFPALAMLTAQAWHAESLESVNTRQKSSRWFTVPAWLLVIAAAVAGAVFVVNMDALLPREARGISGNGYNLLAVLILLGGTMLVAWLLLRKRTLVALLAQSATIAVLGLVALVGVLPNVSQVAQGPILNYLSQVQGQPLMLFEIQRPSLTFYGQRRVPRFVEEDRPQLLLELNRHPQTYVITKNNHVPEFKQLLPAAMRIRLLDQGPVYSLLSVDTVK